jgi:hypothetical protein
MVIEAGHRLTLTVGWPRYPTITATGRVSRSKVAGKPLPWLSANVVHGLLSGNPKAKKPSPMGGRLRVHQLKVWWREAFADAARETLPGQQIEHPVRVEVVLHRAAANAARATDVAALVEGSKPCLDGLVAAGLLVDDGPAYVKRFDGGAVLRCPKGEARVELRLRAVA